MNHSAAHRRLRNTLLVVLVVVVAVGGLTLYLHLDARAKFAEVKEAVGRIQIPAGAALLTESGDGDGLSAYTCIDTHCPAYGRAYAVQISPESEMTTVRRLLESAGFEVTASSEDSCVRQGDWQPICYAESRAADLLVTARLEFPTPQWHDWVPQQLPLAGAEWRRLTISASDY